MPKHRDPHTLDLLAWRPPQVAVGMPDQAVRGGTLNTKIARAVGRALSETTRSRDEVAAAMSDYLGQSVTKNMIDAYASPAREDHRISLERFIALIEATEAFGLLGFLAEMFGHVVVPARYAALIELHMTEEQLDALTQRKQALLAKWRTTR